MSMRMDSVPELIVTRSAKAEHYSAIFQYEALKYNG